MVIFYYNWNGSVKSMQEWEKEATARLGKVKGLKIIGTYTPSIHWNRSWLIETDSVDLLMKNFGERTDNIRNTDMVILM